MPLPATRRTPSNRRPSVPGWSARAARQRSWSVAATLVETAAGTRRGRRRVVLSTATVVGATVVGADRRRGELIERERCRRGVRDVEPRPRTPQRQRDADQGDDSLPATSPRRPEPNRILDQHLRDRRSGERNGDPQRDQRPSGHSRALRRQQRVDGPVPQVQAVRQHTGHRAAAPSRSTSTHVASGRAAHPATSNAESSEWTNRPPWNSHGRRRTVDHEPRQHR